MGGFIRATATEVPSRGTGDFQPTQLCRQACESAGAATQRPPTTIRHPRHRPGYVGVDSTPFAGRASSSGAGCSQPAWLFEDARDGRLVGDVGQDLEWTPAGFAHEGVRLVDLADEPKDRPPCAGRLFGQMKTPMASPLAGASVAVAADESAYGSVLLARPGTASLELPSLG